jgi:hypothetical protein
MGSEVCCPKKPLPLPYRMANKNSFFSFCPDRIRVSGNYKTRFSIQPVELGLSYAVQEIGPVTIRVMTARPGGVRLKQSGLSAFTAGL